MLSLRALTPDGYMPGSQGSGLLFELCPSGMPAEIMQALADGEQHHHGHADGQLRPQTGADANAGEVSASGMMGNMGTSVDMLADAFNAAGRDLTWDSVDAVIKYRLHMGDDAEWRFEFGSKTRAPSYQDHVAGINRANGSDIPVGERLYGAERTLSAGVVWTF